MSLISETGSGRQACKGLTAAHEGCIENLRTLNLDPNTQLPLMDIPGAVQRKVCACEVYRKALHSAVLQHKGNLRLILYVDEVIAGNPLRPDPSRKALIGYIAFLECSLLSLESMWLTYFVIRSEDMNKCTGGCPCVMTAVLRHSMDSTRDGFAVSFQEGDADLVFCTEVIFLADADGLRMATGWKGAAALRPCPKCSNVLMNGRSMPGFVDITAARNECTPCSHEELMDVHAHLRSIDKKVELLETEKLLGWKLDELSRSFLTCPDLRGWVRLENLHVDPMHVYWSNGLVAQELGLWWTAVHAHYGNRVCASLLTEYVVLWEAAPGSFAHQRPWKTCVSAKVFRPDADYKGDANQCTLALPLCVAFCLEVLHDECAHLLPQIESLHALYLVCLALQQMKGFPRLADELAARQEAHRRCFLAAYGAEAACPKMHLAMHLADQCKRWGKVLDCFCCERKHRAYKRAMRTPILLALVVTRA